jgi:hypothetical protein
MSSSQCPDCGLAITYPAANCPLCQASLIRVNRRRVLLWATVLGEFLLILILNLAGRAHGQQPIVNRATTLGADARQATKARRVALPDP